MSKQTTLRERMLQRGIKRYRKLKTGYGLAVKTALQFQLSHRKVAPQELDLSEIKVR